ncbi:amino acid adenylation domain-containing protein [Saccharopolyspora shandongensis]|uniref:amino acid adenylation domain-containing protein n=1 Tax=Saccharopolyspora shandongensis TaxID=418495 RepID=UPI003422375C
MFGDLYARLRAHADEDPSRVALTFVPAYLDDGRVQLTYGELVERSRQLAEVLAGRLQPGERALLLFPTAPEFAVSFLGCLAAGVIAVPVPIPVDESAQRRVLKVAEDCQVSAIVSMSLVHDLAAAGTPEIRQLCDSYDWILADAVGEAADGARRSRRLPAISAEDTAFLQYTSGSTRSPRGVVVSHGGLMCNEAAIRESFGVTRDSTIVSWLPLHHDMGLIGGLLQPLYTGARGVILDPSSFVRRPASWLEAISAENADISGGPNFAYDLCTRKVDAAEMAGLDLSSWRVAFNGAAQVFPRTMRSFSEKFRDAGFRPESHKPCYGLAEATLLVTSTETSEPSRSRHFSVDSLESGVAREAGAAETGVRELVSYPLPSHAVVRVVDPATLQPVDDGHMGEILVAGGSNGAGYWGDPDGTAATFGAVVAGEDAGPFVRTGDLGFVHGGELYIEGRSKDLIVHRGRNLHPEDLEADISSCDRNVRPGCGAVFGVRHDGDEAVVVCQEVREHTPSERYPEIVEQIRATLTRIHGVAARTVVLVPPRTVTKTSSGKVQRHAAKQRFLADELPALFSDTLAPAAQSQTDLAVRLAAGERPFAEADVPARVEMLTRALCEHLHEVLRLPAEPRGDESLASLGADSMMAVQLQYAVEEALGVVLLPSLTLRAESIADLARAAVGSRVPAATTVPPPSDDGAEYELNAAQRALWFLHRAFPDSSDYNVTRAFRITGELDVAALSDALDAVVRCHPSLRLAVVPVDGEPRGIVRRRNIRADVVDARSWSDDEESEWYREFATKPFELENGPLLRAAVLRRSGDWLLVLSLHHIVCDVSSLSIIVEQLAQAYADGMAHSIVEGVASPAARERAVLDERGDELEVHWREELAGELPKLSLPQAEPGEPGERGTGASVSFEADAELTSTLARFARESGLTLHNVLLAAFQVLLHRLTGQPDVLVGVPTAGRGDRRLASWVGYLVNVVPVRSSFAPALGFDEFARRTQRRVLDALDHRDLPLSHITRLVNPDRENAAATIFQAMFTYYTTALPGGGSAAAVVMGDPDATLPMGECGLHSHPAPDYTTQSDVGLNVAVRHDTLGFHLQYDPERVTRGQVDQIVATFRTLLAAIGERPRDAVDELALLTSDEVDALLAASIGPEVARPDNYLDSFEQWADRCPDALAADDGAVRLTYAELDERANHVAARLREQGVGVDANVVVCAERSVDYLVALVGIHKADGCYVPISPREAPRRAAAMVAATAPAAAIASTAGRALLAGALDASGRTDAPDTLDLAELAAGRSGQRPPRACPDHGASTIIHTSGSTGIPKAAVSTNYGVTNHMWQMVEHFGLGPDDCVAQTAPVSFDISVWQLLTPLMIGARVRIVPEPASQSPAGLLRATVEGGVTMLELVPSNIVALLDAGLAASPGALRVMLSTGEALTGDVLRRWVRELPEIPMHNAYGPAECTDDVTAGLCAAGPDAPMTVSVGRPLANTAVLILDDNMVPVPAGVVGVLHVGGGAVGRGYRGNPRRTAEMFVPDPFSAVPGGRLYRTGDLARATADGDIEFLGRADTQIKIRGQRIEAGEVEAALRDCEGVVEAAVKVHHGSTGASLVGYVGTGAEGDGEPRVLAPGEDERLRQALAEMLPRHMIPTILVQVPRLPRSKNGKVDYPALQFSGPPRGDDDELGDIDDPLSAAVRSIWATLLERDVVAWQDSFFQLGGHSLLALTMIDRVAQTLDVELAVDAVFAHPRLRDFVTAVRRADPASPDGRRVGVAPAGARFPALASAAQQRFWFLHEMDPGQPTYNMPGVLWMRGVLDEDALDAALHAVLARHPVLLARFSAEDGPLTWTPGSADDFMLARRDLRGPVAEFGDEVFDRMVTDDANEVVDLRREIPFRALLARLRQKEWALCVTIDHIACDGWSLSVFLSDLAEGYNRRVRGTSSVAPEIEYGFADYCHEEQAWRENRDRDSVAALWRGVADGPVSLSPLPTRDAPGHSPGAGRHSRWIDEDLAGAVRELAGRNGTTPYLVFATALSTLVHSGSAERESVLLGTLIAQRDRPEWRRVVGPLLNVSVLAVDLALTDSVAAALGRTRDGALRAYRSSHIPFQELVPLFAPTPGGDGSPFDVMLVMQPADAPAEFDGLTTELTDVDTGSVPYPLTVDIEERDGRYRVSYRYATDRYDPADVEELAERLHASIAAIAADPDRTVEELRSLTAAPHAERS